MPVSSGPGDTRFAIPRARTITEIGTYHWYGPRGNVGYIGLQNVNNGTVYGPWQASGYTGLNGAQDVLWVVSPNVYLPAGTYKIIDSGQNTWSYVPNDCTGSAGLCWVFAQQDSESQAPIHLASTWLVREWSSQSNYVGTWIRRPGTNTFDAYWNYGSVGSVQDVIDITSVQGNEIVLHRHGLNGDYTGTISPDGKSISGTASWYDGPGAQWSASIPI
jgi:hypothetical protein